MGWKDWKDDSMGENSVSGFMIGCGVIENWCWPGRLVSSERFGVLRLVRFFL